MGLRGIFVCACLAGVAGLAAWFFQGTAAPPRAALPGGAAPRPDAGDGRNAPARDDLRAVSAPVAQAAPRAAVPGAPEPGLDEPASPGEPLTVIVKGRVRARVPDLQSSTISLQRPKASEADLRPPSVETRPGPDGSFELDATQLLPFGGAINPPDHLELTVDHPACLTHRSRVVLREFRPGAPRFEPPRDRLHGRKEYEVLVELESCAVLVGHIERDPQPEYGYGNVWLAAIAIEGGALAEVHHARVRAERSGSFRLKVQQGARYAVVAVDQERRPATAIVDVREAIEYRVSILLEEGLSLAGSLRLGAEASPAWVGVVFMLEGQHTERHDLSGGTRPLVWVDESFEWARGVARTDDEGRFQISGLGPFAYEVSVLGLGMPGVNTRAASAGRVEPPDHTLELGPLFAQVSLAFLPAAEGAVDFFLRPVDEPDLTLGPYRSDAFGRALLWLPPDGWFDVTIGEHVVGRVETGATGARSEWEIRR